MLESQRYLDVFAMILGSVRKGARVYLHTSNRKGFDPSEKQ
jgi:hypothetical protein